MEGAARGVRRARHSAGGAAFYYFYEMPAQERMAMRQQELDGLNAKIDKGRATARQLRSSSARSGTCRCGSKASSRSCPDEKDAADLLRRVNTLALQSNLTHPRLQAAGDRHQADSRRVADHARTRGHVSQPRLVPRSREQVPANHQRRRARHQGQTERRRNFESTIEVTCTATTFVLLDPSDGAGQEDGRRAPKKTE